MKKPYLIVIVIMLLFSCAPVLRKDIMDTATVNVPFSDIRENPDLYTGKVFILGGIIVDTRVTSKGSLVEAIYVPVDSRGYLEEDVKNSDGRFLALYPKDKGLLDPQIYRKGRKITIAGEFIETHTGKIDEMEYVYPFFEIVDIHLWKKEGYYITPYSGWYYYPYPYPYWWGGPWWRHPYPPPPYWY